MNARQKAKYWKKMYEQIASNPSPVEERTRNNIVRLMTIKCYPFEFLQMGEEECRRRMIADMSSLLGEELKKYIRFIVERESNCFNHEYLRAESELWVVDLSKENTDE